MPKCILYLHASAELYGSDLILLQLVRHLDRSRYTPLVVLPFHGPLEERLAETGVEVVVMPLAVLRRSLFHPWGVVRFLVTLIRSARALCRIIRARNVAAVHTNTGAVWSGEVAAMLCRIPHFSSVMEIVEKPVVVSAAMAWVVSTLSSQVFTVSRAVKEHFLRFGPWWEDRYVELFPPVEVAAFSRDEQARRRIRDRLGVDDETVVVGLAGRLNHWKGQEIFVEACRHVRDRLSHDRRVHFLVLGGPVPGKE